MRRILTAFLFIVLFAPAAQADHFVITAGGDNLVKFRSTAPMESFEGKTRQVSGTVEVNLSAVGDTVSATIRVDLASLDTGIKRRNGHMRDNHLETDKYPYAIFTGATILSPEQVALAEGTTVSFELTGSFALHGVTRRLHTIVDVTLNGDDLRIQTTFDVSLPDYNIKRPRFLILKLNEVQKVTIDVVAKRTN